MSVEFVDTNVFVDVHELLASRSYRVLHHCDEEVGCEERRGRGSHRRLVRWTLELGCDVLWSEDLSSGQRYGSLTVRNPFV